MYESIKEASPLRTDIVEKGIDFVVVRELTGAFILENVEEKSLMVSKMLMM